MTQYYWVKLWVHDLDDPSIATLPDRLWRRLFELKMIAKKYCGDDGCLIEPRQIAWALRISLDDLELDLSQLQQAGKIQLTEKGWFIPGFSHDQENVKVPERVAAYRDRKRESNASVTKSYIEEEEEADVAEDRSTEAEEEVEVNNNDDNRKNFDLLRKRFEKETGLPGDGTKALYEDQFLQMVKAGVKPVDITNAVAALRDREYIIVSPKSITQAAIIEMGNRKTKPKKSHSKQSEYDEYGIIH